MFLSGGASCGESPRPAYLSTPAPAGERSRHLFLFAAAGSWWAPCYNAGRRDG
jgi:hypothetical protein